MNDKPQKFSDIDSHSEFEQGHADPSESAFFDRHSGTRLTSADGSKGVIVTIAEGEPDPNEPAPELSMVINPSGIKRRLEDRVIYSEHKREGRLVYVPTPRGPENPRVIWPRRVYRQLSKFNNPQALRRARNR